MSSVSFQQTALLVLFGFSIRRLHVDIVSRSSEQSDDETKHKDYQESPLCIVKDDTKEWSVDNNAINQSR